LGVPLQNFWDAGCHDGDVGEPPLKAQQEEEEAAFNSSCACASATHEQGYRTPTDSFTIHCERPRLNPTLLLRSPL
jgi:hypothetical protein